MSRQRIRRIGVIALAAIAGGARDTGPAPSCRIEISPAEPRETDCFLHVLTAAAATTESVPKAAAQASEAEVSVTLASTRVTFTTDKVGGAIRVGGRDRPFALRVARR